MTAALVASCCRTRGGTYASDRSTSTRSSGPTESSQSCRRPRSPRRLGRVQEYAEGGFGSRKFCRVVRDRVWMLVGDLVEPQADRRLVGVELQPACIADDSPVKGRNVVNKAHVADGRAGPFRCGTRLSIEAPFRAACAALSSSN